MYFDTKQQTFGLLRVSDHRFKISTNHSIFAQGANVSLPFEVTNNEITRQYNIHLQVQNDIFGEYNLSTNAFFNMYVSTSAPLPVSLEAFVGNAPTFEVLATPSLAYASVKYAEIIEAKLPPPDSSETTLSQGNQHWP